MSDFCIQVPGNGLLIMECTVTCPVCKTTETKVIGDFNQPRAIAAKCPTCGGPVNVVSRGMT